jgi:hypothetical protein
LFGSISLSAMVGSQLALDVRTTCGSVSSSWSEGGRMSMYGKSTTNGRGDLVPLKCCKALLATTSQPARAFIHHNIMAFHLNTGMYGFSFSEQCILMEDDADRSNVGVYDTCCSDNG